MKSKDLHTSCYTSSDREFGLNKILDITKNDSNYGLNEIDELSAMIQEMIVHPNYGESSGKYLELRLMSQRIEPKINF